MEQMLRNTIAEQERELARRRGAREGDRDRMADRSTAASEQLSQLSIFYALVQTVVTGTRPSPFARCEATDSAGLLRSDDTVV